MYTPVISEIWYRQKLLSYADRKSYNRGSDNFDCITLTESNLRIWYEKWVNAAPVNYYAYIVSAADRVFIGEVYLHKNHNEDMYDDCYDMCIFIEDQYRGIGYGKEALGLLLDVAFCELGAVSIQNIFYKYQLNALMIHLYAGFKIFKDKYICRAKITKRDYFGNRK